MVSTCRPTRGAIAVVPLEFHDQIASTGFSIIRAHKDINPFYLQYALRLPSTLEQFRKWSTGSSYPAILDEDVAKTLIPVPVRSEQDRIATLIIKALDERRKEIQKANENWENTLNEITNYLSIKNISKKEAEESLDKNDNIKKHPTVTDELELLLNTLPPLTIDNESGRRKQKVNNKYTQ
nr:hypothetical protein [Photorhabdus australis]